MTISEGKAKPAYYNEHEPKTAAWLRELIKAGLIAHGEVDERSIIDVRAAELSRFGQCHFFAGIGGWSYALRLAGWSDERPVWTGSCPCQSFSSIGTRSGQSDARHLWPAWFDLVRECCPPKLFGEQVESAIGHGWLDLICDDLEAEGYAVGAVVLPAACVGAPHQRHRLWFVADHDQGRCEELGASRLHDQGASRDDVTGRCSIGPWSAVEWLPCRDGKARPVERGVFPLAYGLSDDMGASGSSDEPATALEQRWGLMMNGYGNAIVPQVAAAFIRASDEAC